MPLGTATDRELVHTRTIVCQGYRRSDGLWDIEGHLVDVKAYSFPTDRSGGVKPAGEPIHDMWLRLTVDLDFLVHGAEAKMDANPFEMCPRIEVNFQRLIGLTIGPGWRKKVHAALGGDKGCTHLVELLGPLATTAYQTLFSERARLRREAEARGETVVPPDPDKRPALLGTCHTFGVSSPVVKERWPAFYEEPATMATDQA